ncbi:hypothetical protein PR048_021266 [Dryococelus australis]|uniref:Uncharacterized protein n=1 Tax=Dryococelus australis TaxID=614101 RepID=A0ABQ9GXQ1_9NEOP|nr:hypothetical protein PR048_021266 [Dryococelus australis]
MRNLPAHWRAIILRILSPGSHNQHWTGLKLEDHARYRQLARRRSSVVAARRGVAEWSVMSPAEMASGVRYLPPSQGWGKRENPPTNGIVRRDSHLRKPGDPAWD